jgi:FKBP12-rapamycin complex-associated protein
MCARSSVNLTPTRSCQFMQSRYVEVCDQILQYKDHRDSLIRRSVIELIPAMATYNHAEFISSYLHKSMVYLLGQLKRDRDRAACKWTA